MTIYYVDYENVHAGVDGMDKLSAEDTVRVFYSPKADTMRIAFVEQALNASAKIDLISVDNGTPNALDFQLVAWLFSELPKGEDEHVIVSNDHGYDAAIRMGVRLGFPEVRRVSCIAEALGLEPTQLDEPVGKRRSSSRRSGSRRRGSAAAAATAVGEEAAVAEEPQVEELPAEELVAEVVAAEETVAEAAEAAPEEEAPKPRRSRRRRRSTKVEAAPVEETAAEEAAAAEALAAEEIAAEPAAEEVPAVEEAAFEPEPEPEPEPELAVEPAPEVAAELDLEPAEEAPKPRRSRRRRSGKSDAAKEATAKAGEFLAEKGAELLEDQLNVVVKAAQSAASKQEFYRTIIQKLGQKQGLAVYGQVKAYFNDLVAQVK